MAFYQKNFALITGASSGIGLAIAEELANKNINLVLVALPDTGLEETALRIAETYGITVLHFAIDLTHPPAATSIFQWCMAQGVVIRILVNNAGLGNIDYLEESRVETLNTIIMLNNLSVTLITHAFLGHMKKHSPGFILNVGSLASFLPIPRKSVYSATKSFVYAFSCALRNEVASTGISVSCLCPGSTQTSGDVKRNLESTAYKGDLFTQTPREVALEAVEQMFKGRRRIIPGWQNKLLFLLWTILPYTVASSILIRLFKKEKRVVASPKIVLKKPSLSIALMYR